MMTESNSIVIAPPIGESEGLSDEEPGPSPAAVMILHDGWRELAGAPRMVHDAVNAAIALAPELAGAEIAIALSSDDGIRQLNAQFRGQDKPTNVLSFPAAASPSDPNGGDASGDIIIALETLLLEAEAERKRPLDHLAHLTVHGLLHLAGYDHDDDAEAEDMEALERRILHSLSISDPYRSDTEEDHPLNAVGAR
jgi:probable rRNA maturation factor